MPFSIRYSQAATEDLAALDQLSTQRIVLKIRHYCSTEKPMSFAKMLHGDLAGHYRFRVGHYRVIFVIEKSGKITICVIERIKHRQEVYE